MALVFLRVISACADGKIRIYNFLNGNCLKVMKANGRGDPVLSFFIQGNRWVVGAEVRAVGSSVWLVFFSSGIPALHLLAAGERGQWSPPILSVEASIIIWRGGGLDFAQNLASRVHVTLNLFWMSGQIRQRVQYGSALNVQPLFAP